MRNLILVFSSGMLCLVAGMDDKFAECTFKGILSGTIMIKRPKDKMVDVEFMGTIKNLSSGQHGFHVHEYGKLTNDCKDAGGHYNPKTMDHGGLISAQRHEGDLENILSDADRHATIGLTLPNTDINQFIGRSLVVHEMVDDLGLGGHPDSLTTGNSGTRLDCCHIHWHGENSAPDKGGLVLSLVLGLLSLLL